MIAAHRFYDNKYAHFAVQDGILFITYKSNTTLNLAVAKLVVTDRIRFQNNTTLLCGVILEALLTVTKRVGIFLLIRALYCLKQ